MNDDRTIARELIDIGTAHRLTGLARPTLYKLVRQGRLKGFRVLTALRLDKDEVLSLIGESRPGERG